MTDTLERIWVSDLPTGPIDTYDLLALGFAWNKKHGRNPVRFIREDLSDQAITDAYARGVADARKVKPLVWVKGYASSSGQRLEAATPFGRYTLVDTLVNRNARVRVYYTGSTKPIKTEPNMDAARAWSEADYERRSQSALVDL